MTEKEKAEILLRFIDIARQGMVKPFDPTPILSKIESFEKKVNRDFDGDSSGRLNLSQLKNCCSDTAVITDAKEFKPYIYAALEEFSRLMNLKV